MALVNSWIEEEQVRAIRPSLTVLDGGSAGLRVGLSIAERRRRREALLRRRRRTLTAAALVFAAVLISWPGHAFGTLRSGVNADLGSNDLYGPGQVYVVQPGDTITSIARMIAPNNVAVARRALIANIGTSYVIPGEHVVIP
jgi:hypothetical protein